VSDELLTSGLSSASVAVIVTVFVVFLIVLIVVVIVLLRRRRTIKVMISVSLSYLIDERKLLFYSKIRFCNNGILRTFICLTGVSYDYFYICSKYLLQVSYSSRREIRQATWNMFSNSVISVLLFSSTILH